MGTIFIGQFHFIMTETTQFRKEKQGFALKGIQGEKS